MAPFSLNLMHLLLLLLLKSFQPPKNDFFFCFSLRIWIKRSRDVAVLPSFMFRSIVAKLHHNESNQNFSTNLEFRTYTSSDLVSAMRMQYFLLREVKESTYLKSEFIIRRYWAIVIVDYQSFVHIVLAERANYFLGRAELLQLAVNLLT